MLLEVEVPFNYESTRPMTWLGGLNECRVRSLMPGIRVFFTYIARGHALGGLRGMGAGGSELQIRMGCGS